MLKKGEQICGHVTPAYDFDPPSKWEEAPLDSANIFVVSLPEGDMLKHIEVDTDIIVRSDLVELSYRVKDTLEVRERYPHLFSDSAEDVGSG